MSDFYERISKLPPKRLALLTVELHEKLEAERARSEPLAIIGMSCRFPGGARDPESFWRLLAAARSRASQHTSSARRCCGSMPWASRGAMPKNSGSKRSAAAMKPPKRVDILPGASGSGS